MARGISTKLAGGWSASLILIIAACSGDPDVTDPEPATELHVSVSTTGDDFDLSGYVVIVGPDTSISGVQAESEFRNVLPGSHMVQLTDVASNCTVSGNATREVTVIEGEITEIGFDVSCTALPPASVDVTGTWIGEATDLSTYESGTVASVIHVLRQTGSTVVADSLDMETPSSHFPAKGVGRVSGTTLTLFYTVDTEVGRFRITNTIIVSGNEMEGTSVEQLDRFEANLALSKQ
jgi:hypothetical protein